MKIIDSRFLSQLKPNETFNFIGPPNGIDTPLLVPARLIKIDHLTETLNIEIKISKELAEQIIVEATRR